VSKLRSSDVYGVLDLNAVIQLSMGGARCMQNSIKAQGVNND
jgi:hypothetical protein